MFNFQQFINEQVLNHPKIRELSPKVEITEGCIQIISPVDKDLEMVFIQHSELNFEAKLEIYFQHEKYGECWDMLIDIDCLPQKIEKGFFCVLSEEKDIYPTLEKLLYDLLIQPLLTDKILDHFLFYGVEFWVSSKHGIQFVSFLHSVIQQYKLRQNDWVQIKGKSIPVDNDLLYQLIEMLKIEKDLGISKVQRKFNLGYNRASNLLSVAKIIMREE